MLLLEQERSPQRAYSFCAGVALNTGMVAILVMVRFAAWQPQPAARSTNAILIAPAPAHTVHRSATPATRRRTLTLPAPAPQVSLLKAPDLPPVLRSEAVPPLPVRSWTAPAPPAVLNGSFPTATAQFPLSKPVWARPAETGSFQSTVASSATGTASRGIATPAGFGAEPPGPSGKAAIGGSFTPSGFETAALAPPRAHGPVAAATGAFQSVEILNKPKPDYSEEARRKRVEGEVWLEVLFAADGTPRVQRVLRSLGFGLDENAVRSAQQIRFRPAREGARDIDQVATVRVQFQLAE